MMLFEGLFWLILLLFIAPVVIRRVRVLEGASFMWQSALIWGGLLVFLVVLYHQLGLKQQDQTIFLQDDSTKDNLMPYDEPPSFEDTTRERGTDL